MARERRLLWFQHHVPMGPGRPRRLCRPGRPRTPAPPPLPPRIRGPDPARESRIAPPREPLLREARLLEAIFNPVDPSSPRKRGPRDAMGRAARTRHHRRWKQPTGCPMPQPNDLGRSLAALDQDSTLIAVIEMSQSIWLVAGIVPGINRQPLKKLGADETALLQLLYRWRDEATKAGRTIDRIAVAYEAGRDGFWLA